MTSRFWPPLPLAGEGRGEGKPCERRGAPAVVALLVATVAACGNYSNEDLEYMNAVPAREDIAATMPRSNILPANEAELSRLTHDVVNAFNGMLAFLELADHIRTFQPTSRIPNGRIWGPAVVEEHPAWQWRFRVARVPNAPGDFEYAFEMAPIGSGEAGWLPFITGSFAASAGVRKGVGMFAIQTDMLRDAGYPFEMNAKGETLRLLTVDYSTEGFPISVEMHLELWTGGGFVETVMIDYVYEAQSNGQGAMEFKGTDSATGWTLGIVSRWLATGRGRADARAMDGAAVDMTRVQCWDDSFRETYNRTPWAPQDDVGDISACPEIPVL
jgi:hypothetical protein